MAKYKKEFDDEQEYIGNIWGWRFSLLSLAIILGVLCVMGIRYCHLQEDHAKEATEIVPE